MAKIIVYNNDEDRFEVYHRGENDPMPYNSGGTLRVREFRGSSTSPTLWTTKRVMQSWNGQRLLWGGPIPVGFVFKRGYEGRSWNAEPTLCSEQHLMLLKDGQMHKEQLLEAVQFVQDYGFM